MSHLQSVLQRLAEAQNALQEAERVMYGALAKANAARAAREALSPTATDREIRAARDLAEVAAERASLAVRAHAEAQQALVDIQTLVPHAEAADESVEADALVAQMFGVVRRSRALRSQADALEQTEFAPIYDKYITLVGLEGQVVDYRIDPDPARPRTLLDFNELLAREELGEAYLTPWQRSPRGSLEHFMEVKRAADELANRSRPTGPEPRLLDDQTRAQLAHCIDVRGATLSGDLLLDRGVEIGQFCQLAGRPVPDHLPVAHPIPITSQIEFAITVGLPRVLSICEKAGRPYTGPKTDWNPPTPPPQVQTLNPLFEYGDPQ